MIFWDSSAMVPILLAESRSRDVHDVLRSDDQMIVWWSTPVECVAAIAQGERAGEYGVRETDQARARLAVLRHDWNEILPTEEVRTRATALLGRHPLRSADGLQLGAALTWARGRPEGHRFMTLDRRLGGAARGEGFTLALE